MTVYVTKYALTEGIQKVDDTEFGIHVQTMITVKSMGCFAHFHGEGVEWHRTFESAKERACEMRDARIRGLKKQIEKLEKIRF